jgi:hypothetical protein
MKSASKFDPTQQFSLLKRITNRMWAVHDDSQCLQAFQFSKYHLGEGWHSCYKLKSFCN